jgi:hypothetical protein
METLPLLSMQLLFIDTENTILSELAEKLTYLEHHTNYLEGDFLLSEDEYNLAQKGYMYSSVSYNDLLKEEEKFKIVKVEYEKMRDTCNKANDVFVNLCNIFDVLPSTYKICIGEYWDD